MRLLPVAPVLSITNVGFASISLSWTDVSVSSIPVQSYTLYRGTGEHPLTFIPVVTQLVNNRTFVDSTVLPGTTYIYYVVGRYTTGPLTDWSNYVTGTTLMLRYIYTLRSGGLDIYDLLDPANPVYAATVAPPPSGSGGTPYGQASDSTYFWMNDGSSLFTYQWNLTPFAPTLVHSLLAVFPFSPLGGAMLFLLRRGLVDRNNILIVYNQGNTYFGALESYDITDPTNPVLINAQAVTDFVNARGYAYDSVSHKIFAIGANRYDHAYLYSWDVASDGTLGAATLLGANIDISGRDWTLGWIYNGYYWSAWPPTGNVAAFRLDGGGFAPGLGGGLPGPGVSSWGGCQPRVKGKYLFLGNGTNDATTQAVCIIDMSTWTVVAQLGGLNKTCDGMVVARNMLVFSVHDTLYTYDITALLASGAVPVMLGSLVLVTAYSNGLTGYYADGWEGNNGGCAS